MEKRNINTGVLDSSFDTDGVVISNPAESNETLFSIAVDSGYVYLAGYDKTLDDTNTQWRLEKRNITTGALDTTFDADGILTMNISDSSDIIYSIDVDFNYIYIAGIDYSPGDSQWRLEKRIKTTGGLE